VSRESLFVSQGQAKQRQRPDPRPNFKTQAAIHNASIQLGGLALSLLRGFLKEME
jgi:hypothetical protein